MNAFEAARPDIDRLLAEHFGWTEFRPLQREIIECVLAGESALAVLPTGGGKSLCYQLPALALPGMTLVVSPLISLMKDQVDGLVSRGIGAVAVNSHDTPFEMDQKLGDIASGRVRIAYVAPERLKSASFLQACRSAQVSLLAIDEAHCVSQWGHDFRPDYRFIKDFRAAVGSPPMLALTATATRRVQEDVATQLGIRGARRLTAGVDRPNLWLGIESCGSVAEKRGKVAALAARAEGSAIVYVTSRKDAESFAELLEDSLGEPVAPYHAGLSPDVRTAVQNRFMAGLLRIVVATNAFGMGIDKADIRAVIHAGIPESIEAYLQEVGRAGRDGEPSECTLVVVPGMDVKVRQVLLEKDEPTKDQVQSVLRSVRRAVEQGEGVMTLPESDQALGTLVLSHLQALDRLELLHRTAAGVRVRANRPLTPDVADEVQNRLREQVRAKRERFRLMRRFVYLKMCRRRFLLRYFGEEPIGESEACCSACHPRPVEARELPRPARRRSRSGPANAYDQGARSTPQNAGGNSASGSSRLPSPTVHADSNPQLLHRLKEWRRTKAKEQKVPAYIVFGDRDLASIASAAPRDLDQLAACRGVGPKKLEMYGEEVLALVRSWRASGEELKRAAADLFGEGRTPREAASVLEADETQVWEAFLAWVTETSDAVWKKQVRSVLAPKTYLVIRAELAAGPRDSSPSLVRDLEARFGARAVALTRAVMERVGELSPSG